MHGDWCASAGPFFLPTLSNLG